jgi:hypothetical protein
MNSQGFIELDKLVTMKYISPSLDSKLLKIDCPQSIECRLAGGRPRVRRREGWEKWVLEPVHRDSLITEELETAKPQLVESERELPWAPVISTLMPPGVPLRYGGVQPGAPIMSRRSLPTVLISSSRCKVYRLKESGWVDLGVGICSTGQSEPGDRDSLLVVESEDDSAGIVSTNIAGKQFQVQGDTMIVWTESDGTDMALSFQDGTGRDAVWQWLRVHEVLAPYPADETSEEEQTTIKCDCGISADDGNTVLCERCDTWQHIICYYESAQQVPDVHECVDCNPRPFDRTGAAEKQQKQLERRKVMGIAPFSSLLPSINYTRTDRISRAKKVLQVHNCACGRTYTRAKHLKRHQRTCDRQDTHNPDGRVERLQTNDQGTPGLYSSEDGFDSRLMGDEASSRDQIPSQAGDNDDSWSTRAQGEYAGSKWHELHIRTQDGVQQARPSTDDAFRQLEYMESSYPLYNQIPDRSGNYHCPEELRQVRRITHSTLSL